MEFTISRETLLKPLQFAGSVVERRQTMPILSNVRLALEDGVLSVTGTDLEVEVVGRAVLEQAGSEGQTTAPARKLLRNLQVFAGGCEPANCGGGWKASDRIRALALFPSPPCRRRIFPRWRGEDPACCFSLEADELKRLIDRTAFAMANQDVRYYLNGMLWEVTDERFRTVATDGHRLALAEHWGEYPGGGERWQVIVPRKGVIELGAHPRRGGGRHPTLPRRKLRAGGGPRFPLLVETDSRGLTPTTSASSLETSRGIWSSKGSPSARRSRELAILTNEKFKGIRLNIERDRLRILGPTIPNRRKRKKSFPSNTRGEGALEIGFNVTYLLDVLRGHRRIPRAHGVSRRRAKRPARGP
ncbi:MAG: DNA polymerase III subunit beta [Porticoccaceae bacterium]|nr:MAG: DNA polymerase III subunit beta [Porticoccaceae bacterium]